LFGLLIVLFGVIFQVLGDPELFPVAPNQFFHWAAMSIRFLHLDARISISRAISIRQIFWLSYRNDRRIWQKSGRQFLGSLGYRPKKQIAQCSRSELFKEPDHGNPGQKKGDIQQRVGLPAQAAVSEEKAGDEDLKPLRQVFSIGRTHGHPDSQCEKTIARVKMIFSAR
jgi:hypothetical protein